MRKTHLPVPSIKSLLEEAWAIATLYAGDSYVAAAHAFVCHSDGSDCADHCLLAADRECLAMLDAARDLVEASMVCQSCEHNPHAPGCHYREYLVCHADVGDLVRLWAARLVTS